MIEPWKEDHCARENNGKRQDQLLRGARFRAWTGLETVFDEVRISAKEVERDGELRNAEDYPEKPGLPEMKCPGGQEKKQRHKDLKDYQPA